ncbi:hypothetical protein IA69_15495 [Massilia sp. JS1662]|nr:hypothetical protein [Massilia sp. JS1662]KGF80921.1 hypothetical protein IA69_15495 [Massilia sp. JS1662]
MKTLLALTMSALLMPPASHAAVIGFDAAAPSGLPLLNAMPYKEAGFSFSSSLGDGMYHNDFFTPLTGVNTNGTTVLGWCASGCGGAKTVSIAGTGAFTLAAIDFASLFEGSGAGTLTITGVRVNGTTVTRSVTYGDAWATTSFAGFRNLQRLDILTADAVDVAMDNIVLTAADVPEPPAMFFAGMALMAVGLLRGRSR